MTRLEPTTLPIRFSYSNHLANDDVKVLREHLMCRFFSLLHSNSTYIMK